MRTFRLVGVICFATAFIGCATIDSDGARQPMLVRSEPPGASVLVNGRVVGHTPAYVAIPRARKPWFQIRTASGDKTIILNSEYRWNGSFWQNFVFYILAPIGWVTDILTETAYDATPPPTFKLQLHPSDERFAETKRTRFIAVAPPLSDAMELSDAGGEALAEALKKSHPEDRVFPYKKTLPIFVANDFDFDGSPREDDFRTRAKAYQKLHAKNVVESVIEARGDDMVLKANMRDVHTHEKFALTELRFHPSDQMEKTLVRNRWLSRLIPNTVGLDIANENFNLTYGKQTHNMTRSSQEAWWMEGLRFLSAINISNMPARRNGRAGRWAFDFVPGARISRRQGILSGFNDSYGSSEQEFTRWWISAGYGVEFGWLNSRHYIYGISIPMLYWNQISWDSAGKTHEYNGQGLALHSEAGYSYFATANWVLKLFIRTTNEDTEGWKSIVQSRNGTVVHDLSVNSVYSGVTIAYRFDQEYSARHWRNRAK